MWTISQVKACLPDVTVKVQTGTRVRIERAIVCGSMLPYAHVHIRADDGLTGENFSFSWDAIVRSLNTDTALKA